MTGYQFRWTLIQWDLPLDTAEAKRAARRLVRNVRRAADSNLWGNARHGAALVMGDEDRARRIVGAVPPDAVVRFLGVTDKQLEQSSIVFGARRPLAGATA